MSATRKDQHTLDNGVVAASLHPLLPQLRLPWPYSVLAACMDPADRGRTHVLVQKHDPHSPQEYVVCRVDPADGTCHGGQYCGDLVRALVVFGERLQVLGLQVAQRTPGDSGVVAMDGGYQPGGDFDHARAMDGLPQDPRL